MNPSPADNDYVGKKKFEFEQFTLDRSNEGCYTNIVQKRTIEVMVCSL